MSTITQHEIAILGYILHKEAAFGTPVLKHAIVSDLNNTEGFSPAITAIKLIELEKSKKFISKFPTDTTYEGYKLTEEGERFVIDNVTLFNTDEKEIRRNRSQKHTKFNER